jgi:putative transposase
VQYRRAKIKGGTYFFTLNLAERQKTLLIDYIDSLRESLNIVKQRHPFKLDAMVVLPSAGFNSHRQPAHSLASQPHSPAPR